MSRPLLVLLLLSALSASAQPRPIFRLEARVEPTPVLLRCVATASGTDRHTLLVRRRGSLVGNIDYVREMMGAGYVSERRTEGTDEYMELRRGVSARMRLEATLTLAAEVDPWGLSLRVTGFEASPPVIETQPAEAERFMTSETRRELGSRMERRGLMGLEEIRAASQGLDGMRMDFSPEEQEGMRARHQGELARTVPLRFCGQEREVRIVVRWLRQVDGALGRDYSP